MTQLKRPQLTPSQATAVEQYRQASAGNDFSRLLFAIVALNDAGLYEADALRALAVGYITKEETE